jgi:hypothetical protein
VLGGRRPSASFSIESTLIYRECRHGGRFTESIRFADNRHGRSRRCQKLVRAAIDGQRAEIVRLLNAGLISSVIMHRVEREPDVEDERLEI